MKVPNNKSEVFKQLKKKMIQVLHIRFSFIGYIYT